MSTIKTFNRLNEKVNQDDFVKILYDEDAIDSYFRNKKVKPEELETIKRYAALLGQAILNGEGSLEYTIDSHGIKGFKNTMGINNVDKDGKITDKLWGYTINYATTKLNNLSAYSEPEPKSDKIKYSNNAIATAINRYIQGKDTLNTQYFLDLDTPENGVRSNTKRAKKFKQALNHITTYWDNIFEGFTLEQKDQAILNIKDIYTIFGDLVISNNEYNELYKATGLNNLETLFGTTVPVELPVEDTPLQVRSNKIKWIKDNYAPYTGTDLISNILATRTNTDKPLGPQSELNFTNFLKGKTNDLLMELLSDVLGGKQIPEFTSTNPNSAGYYLNYILNELKSRPSENNPLISFGDNSGRYYIKDIDTGRNTGLVWDGTYINEKSIHEIPYWINFINNQWNLYQNSTENLDDIDKLLMGIYKSGGVLKARTGSVMDRPSAWISGENTAERANNPTNWNTYFKLDDIIDDILSKNPDILTKTGNDSETPLILEILQQLDDIAKNNNLSFDSEDGITGYKDWNTKYQELTEFNEYFGNDTSLYDMLGPSTYNRRLLLQKLVDKATNKDRLDLVKKLASELVDTDTKIHTNTERTYLDLVDTGLGSSTKTTYFGGGQGADPTSSGGINWGKAGRYVLDHTPEIINTGMLFDSLHSNKNIWKTINNSLNPVLKDTYEKYSPITGAYGEKLLSTKLGSEVMSLAYKPFTSDADLYLARMLEGLKKALDLQYRGFLADDLAIKKSKAEALARLEDNKARRSEVANFNRASINLTIREKAQNTALKMQHDQLSRANFGKSMLDLFYYRDNLRRQDLNKQNNFELALALDLSDILNSEVSSRFLNEYDAWKNYTDSSGSQPNKNKTISDFIQTSEGKKAQSWIDLAKELNMHRLRAIQARILGTKYNDPYKGIYKIDYSKLYVPSGKIGTKLIPRKR